MGKLVKRLMLDDMYTIGRNESWFSDMATKGFHLKKLDVSLFTFKKENQRKPTLELIL